ncbi:MAG: S1 RNA-binding domain-containing protein [Acidobacteriota bacterium]
MSEAYKEKKGGEKRKGKDDFENLMKEYESGVNEISEGEKIEATILSREDDLFYLDLGGRFEGEILCDEFIDPDSLLTGDKVDVYVSHKKGGFFRCSTSRKSVPGDDSGSTNQQLESVFRNGERIRGKVTGINKGGFEVMTEGERGFCPFSQVEADYSGEPEKLIDKVLAFRIIEYDPESDKLVLGRRDIIEEEKNIDRVKLLATLNAGMVKKGTVSSVKNYGAFIDIGGIEGLLHVSEISNEKIDDANSVYKEGDEVEVLIKSIDMEGQKLSLSRKELLGDPWDDFKSKYSGGDRIEGVVSSLKTYGAFLDLMPGIRGLLHISKVGDDKFHRHAKEVFRVGENVSLWIESINDTEKKIALTRVEPGVDLSVQMEKLKKESDKEEKASSGNAFGRLLDSALKEKK